MWSKCIMSTWSINIYNYLSKRSVNAVDVWSFDWPRGPAVKECLPTADDYSLLRELCPNPGGQLKLKPGTTLCLPSIPRYKPPPPLRRISCFCIHKSLQSIKKKKKKKSGFLFRHVSKHWWKFQKWGWQDWFLSVVRSNRPGIVLFSYISQRLGICTVL